MLSVTSDAEKERRKKVGKTCHQFVPADVCTSSITGARVKTGGISNGSLIPESSLLYYLTSG